ncbi:MAG: gamma-glutamyltransferase [Thermomicrobiales bacterium]
MAWPNRGLTHRPVVMGTRGMVASANPLASLAGLRVLMQGGNAVDAAVATAAALNVCEPYMSGIGGIGYMLIYSAGSRRLRVLDYNGPAPKAARREAFAGHAEKHHGPKSPLVPGAAAGWLTAHETHGRLDRADVFAPAIDYAVRGVPLTIKNEMYFRNAVAAGYLEPETRDVFLPGGDVLPAGSVLPQPMLAQTFREVVEGGKDAFYRGSIARRIIEAVQAKGGLLTAEDLAGFEPTWQEPIAIGYRGYAVHCPPPPCSGMQYLQTLKMLAGEDVGRLGHNTPATIHLLVETMKLAVADRIAYAPNPEAPVAALLSASYAAARRALIASDRAAMSEGDRFDGRVAGPEMVAAGQPALAVPECTTHFDVVDGEGNAVAVTQSLGDAFGSGVVAGDTGLVLNNFCYWFDLDPVSPNVIEPGKKAEMCLAPAMVMRDDAPFLVIGTPGSFGIMQTTPQMISNVIDHQMSIQAAIEAPRFKTVQGTELMIETRIPEATRYELTRLGHTLSLLGDWSWLVGGGQGILIDPDTGVLTGGADPRRDGYAMGW